MNESERKTSFLQTKVPKVLLVINAILAIVYFYVIAFWFPQGNPVLFGLLIAGEVFHVWQVFMYIYTVWETDHEPYKDPSFTPPVDVFITVAGEPIDIIEETAEAAKAMQYPDFNVYLLNDGYVAGKDNWRDVEVLAERLGIDCITRTEAGGAKAGNINNGLDETDAPLVVIFDADHVPHPDFLQKTVPYFADENTGYVQTPQYYKNHATNSITKSAWEQQELFFGPICKGKNRLNSATMCGTNMVIRREALEDVGGMNADSIAEDFITGVFIHEEGWKSVFVPEVLAEGLAPEDFQSYYKQQYRWARGALDVIFAHNLVFRRKLSLVQKLQYLSSASFYLTGAVILMDALLPVVFFYTGLIPLEISTMALAAVFLPYIFITLYTLQRSSNFSFTFPSLAFSMGGFWIHLEALFSALTRQKVSFSITSKRALEGNFLHLVIPHIIYVVIVFLGIGFAFFEYGFTPSVINNSAWAILNVAIFLPFIYAASPFGLEATEDETIESPAVQPASSVIKD